MLEAVAVVNFVLFGCTEVVPEHLLIEVAEKMERLNANISPLQAALQKRPEVFESVSVNFPVHVPLRMVNHIMSVVADKSFVGLQPVAQQSGHGSDVFADFAMDKRLATVGDYLRSDFAAAFQDSHYDCLIVRAALHDASMVDCGMHVAGLPADESFVHFDLRPAPAEFHSGLGLHGEPDAMQHEPCRLLSDSDSAAHFVGTDSVLAVRNHPHCDKPLIERERGIFHDGSDFCGELPLGMLALALPDAASSEKANVPATASRASNTVRPPARNHEVNAVIGIGEVNDGLL